MIRNDTKEDYQFCVKVEEDFLEGQWRSTEGTLYKYKIIEKNHLMKQEYCSGYSRYNVLYRQKFNQEGNFIDEEHISENHALKMYPPFLS